MFISLIMITQSIMMIILGSEEPKMPVRLLLVLRKLNCEIWKTQEKWIIIVKIFRIFEI